LNRRSPSINNRRRNRILQLTQTCP
jgi:hypothetical protein